MKKSKKIILVLCLSISIGSILSSCGDNNDGEIVREYKIDGNWLYNAFSYKIETNLIPVDLILTEDIQSKNMTSSAILQLDSKKSTYILFESSSIKDSGRFVIDNEQLQFSSKLNKKPFMQNAYITVNSTLLNLKHDAKTDYENKELLDSLGVANPDAVIITQAYYNYIFSRITE